MRGEYHPTSDIWAFLRELPPHARRILAPGAVKIVGNGTTSACAENTSVRNPRNGGQWNYLRMRGEYLLLSASHSLHPELPPHARRIRLSEIPETAVNGTTSACAENTLGCFSWFPQGWNYLRMRGEYHWFHLHKHIRWELPPHARRIPSLLHYHLCFHGTTSACAENTTPGPAKTGEARNYLRMRGEYNTKKPKPRARKELPPHARRIHLCCLQCFFQLGTTSACAENTFPRRGDVIVHRNYLRMRGEYLTLVNTKEGCGELPPHARRIPWGASHGFHRGGTTSACAENTLEGR